jgi:hypothetical protein
MQGGGAVVGSLILLSTDYRINIGWPGWVLGGGGEWGRVKAGQ